MASPHIQNSFRSPTSVDSYKESGLPTTSNLPFSFILGSKRETFSTIKLYCEVLVINIFQRQSCSCVCLKDMCETRIKIDAYLRILQWFKCHLDLHTMCRIAVSPKQLHRFACVIYRWKESIRGKAHYLVSASHCDSCASC